MKIVPNTDVLLINVPMDRVLKTRKEHSKLTSMPPLGMLYIISSLEAAGFHVSFIDFSVEMFDRENFLDYLKLMAPKIVGISTYVESWKIQNSVASHIRKIVPEAVIVAGGYCASFAYKEMLQTNYYDYIIRGEGEFSYISLCNHLILHKGSINKVNNLVYQVDGKIIMNDFERISDLDQLPYPAREVLDLNRYSYPFTISTARGCPGRCIFCSAHAFWGDKVVMRSSQSVVNEIREVYLTFGLKDFFIIDDTFTLKPARTLEFCKLLNELSRELDVTFVWGCESRVDVVKSDNYLLKTMKDAGCNMVQFGMESGNDSVLKSIKKNITYEQVYHAAQMAYEAGLKMNISFMIGHHMDTMDTIKETIRKAVDLKQKFHANMVFSINTPYPGTELRNQLEELGVNLIVDDFSKLKMNDSAIRTAYLTANDIKKGFSLANQMLY
ncbi:B12-binding domain-containing radical SAM protein [Lacrimispora sp.]|uniref:B12-binding domain-containing radical SAM protein n=1 Tax=Lacrimispora sp. TaxID=2719234 RepID=UPI0039934AFE